MKAVILAGGLGTRISEETTLKPKPMVEVGGKPILWHVMKIYEAAGITDFIICAGYKSHVIKNYFANYALNHSDVTFNLKSNSAEFHRNSAEDWNVTIVDTGEETQTSGRLLKIADYIGDDTFCMTYGDGVGDIDIKKLVSFHKNHGKLATVTAVQPPGRFGVMNLEEENDVVGTFQEKPLGDGGRWINGGFFVLNPGIFKHIGSEEQDWAKEPLQSLAQDKNLVAYRHTGFWQPLDSLRDKNVLDKIWAKGDAPWKVW